jgi:hypothetical protein
LLDGQVQQEERDRDQLERDPYHPVDRQRTAWEAGLPILVSHLRVARVGERELREYLTRLRMDGLDVRAIAGKTGPGLRESVFGQPLGGIERSTDLSAELARLDGEGFGGFLVENLRPRFPEQTTSIVQNLKRGKSEAGARRARTRRPGRPVVGDRAEDRRFFDDWKASDEPLKDFARSRGVPLKEAEAATARERTRRNRERRKHPRTGSRTE